MKLCVIVDFFLHIQKPHNTTQKILNNHFFLKFFRNQQVTLFFFFFWYKISLIKKDFSSLNTNAHIKNKKKQMTETYIYTNQKPQSQVLDYGLREWTSGATGGWLLHCSRCPTVISLTMVGRLGPDRGQPQSGGRVTGKWWQ